MSQTKLPEIRISFSWLLYENTSKKLHELPAYHDLRLRSKSECEKLTEEYRLAWRKYEAKILAGLVQSLDLNFYLPVIDISLAPFFRTQSDPLVGGFRYDPDRFIDILTHELIHVILDDNTKSSQKSSAQPLDLIAIWTKFFGKHDIRTLAHIPVHAVHKHIYLDVLKEPSRFKRDIQAAEGAAYIDSWAYVEKNDYKDIVRRLKESYEN